MDNSDDDFSDDGFDSLPVGTLLQLEQNAFQATQALAAHHTRTFQTNAQLQNGAYFDHNRSLNPPLQHRALSSEYGDLEVGDLDAEVLEDGEVQGDNSTIGRLERHEVFNSAGRHPMGPSAQMDMLQRQEEAYFAHDDDGTHKALPPEKLLAEMEQLRARIDELTRQNETIKQELVAAKDNSVIKAGEASILRSHQTKLMTEYDRQITLLQKRLAEETSKHKGALEAANLEGNRLAAENAFLENDLRDEALKLNSLKAKSKAQEKAPPVTPKKSRVLPFRDGFDDDEMAVLSPTKSSGGRSKRGTPMVPGKRKRKASQEVPIPMASLQLSPVNVPEVDEALSAAEANRIADDKPRPISREDDMNIRYMKRILNHRTPPNTEPDLEVMATLSFPSEPDRKLSSIVLEETASLQSTNYPVEFAGAIIALWSRSLKENFYEPIPMFMALVKEILLLDTESIAPKILEDLVSVIETSVEVNATVRFEFSPVSSRVRGQNLRTPQAKIHTEVDSTEALEIMYLVATACRTDADFHERFWRNIRFDWILLTLNCRQLIEDIVLTINILSTSIRQGFFGCVQNTEEERLDIENYLIERLANLYSEPLEPDEGQNPYTVWQICEMRLEIITFLEMVAFSAPKSANNHGSTLIATHPLVLGRLFRAMHDELDAIYMDPPELELRTTLVNRIMHLIYGVIQNHGKVDLYSKLRLLSGATQKYRIVLSRLAFSEGSYLESGILEDTMEMARRILEDEDMDPQEAEAIFDAFPSGGRLSGVESSERT